MIEGVDLLSEGEIEFNELANRVSLFNSPFPSSMESLFLSARFLSR